MIMCIMWRRCEGQLWHVGFFFDPIENENLVQRGLYLQMKVQQTAAWRGVPGVAACCRLCQQQCHFLALSSKGMKISLGTMSLGRYLIVCCILNFQEFVQSHGLQLAHIVIPAGLNPPLETQSAWVEST